MNIAFPKGKPKKSCNEILMGKGYIIKIKECL